MSGEILECSLEYRMKDAIGALLRERTRDQTAGKQRDRKQKEDWKKEEEEKRGKEKMEEERFPPKERRNRWTTESAIEMISKRSV